MKVTFLGVGSAFSRKNGNSNVLIEAGHTKLLLDYSLLSSAALRNYGLPLKDITHIFITHLHADHTCGLEEIAFMNRLVYKRKPFLISTASLLDRLWNYCLRGGLEYIEKIPGETTPQTIDDFFIPQSLDIQTWTTIGEHSGVSVYLHPTNHVKGIESYGLEVEVVPGGSKKRFFFSGDTKFDPELIMKCSHSCSLLFHDCQLHNSGERNSLGVHASYKQLLQLPEEVRHRMWLYHYGDSPLPDAKKDGFAGFVNRLQSFTL